MSNCVLFTMPGNEVLGNSLLKLIHAEPGEVIIRHFPDGETFIKVLTDMNEREAIIVCTLHHPDDKILPLYFLAKTLKELGAFSVTLVAPYLVYRREDKGVTDGECIGSAFLGDLLSRFIDILITVDPYLHRSASFDEIYSIHTSVLNVGPLVSKWIKENVQQPVLIIPDRESEQWIRKVAIDADAPCIMLDEIYAGNRNANVQTPQSEKFKEHTPVLIEDILATTDNIIETIGHLNKAGMKRSVCIGIHPVFKETSYEKLLKAGTDAVVTCNTIMHTSNGINIAGLLAEEIGRNIFVT